jgi:hypothetical protein
VVVLSDVDTNVVEAAVYVRANDSFSKAGISAGTYQTFIALGQDWDVASGRFWNYANYFRFRDPAVFKTCPLGLSFGSYESLKITLNVSEGPGSDTVSVAPESIPGINP